MEVQVVLPRGTDTIPLYLMVDAMAFVVSQVEMIMVLQMIHKELVQIAPHLQSLKEDEDMTDIFVKDTNSKSLIAMNILPIDLLHLQQHTQNDTMCTLQVIQQCQRDHAKDSN